MKNKFYLYCILCFLFNVAGYSQSTVFESLSFESNKLGRKVSYSIYLPSDYSTSKRNYPVLYLLHGYTDNETNWIQMGQMKTIADRAIANEEAVPMIIVMPDAWDTWYINQYDGKVPYEDMFFEELIPYMEKTYRIRSDKESRAIAGLSMGGYGSLYYGLSHPDMFCYIYACSPATYVEGTPNLYDMMWTEGLPGITVEIGTSDFLYESAKGFRDALGFSAIDWDFIERDGAHDWSFWSVCTPKILKKFASIFE